MERCFSEQLIIVSTESTKSRRWTCHDFSIFWPQKGYIWGPTIMWYFQQSTPILQGLSNPHMVKLVPYYGKTKMKSLIFCVYRIATNGWWYPDSSPLFYGLATNGWWYPNSTPLYTYIYIYTYIHICIHIHIYIRICVSIKYPHI